MAITNASTLAEYASGIGTQNATLTVDANNKRVGVGTTNPLGTFQVGTGVTFWGDAGIGSFTSLKLSGTTDSTSTSTGALVVTGGVGIGLSLTVGGDVSIGGTITYEDVTNIDSLGIITARSGLRVVGGGITCVGVATFFSALDANSTLDVASTSTFNDDVTFTGAAANLTWDKSTDDLIFNDNAQAKFGTDGDLSIYHTGSEALFINNTGITYHRGDVIRFRNQGNSQTLLNAGTAGVDLYGGSLNILQTNVAGVTQTGITTMNSLNYGWPSDSVQPEAALLIKCTGLGGNNRYIGIGASGTGAWLQASSPGYTGPSAPFWINRAGGEFYVGTNGLKFNVAHSGNKVGIGTDLMGYPSYADNLTIANHGLHCGLTIRSGIASQSAIYFSNTTGSAAGTYGGSIYYDHGTKLMSVNTDGTNSLLINEDHGLKVVGIATAATLYEGTNRVSTVGKAIAMAMIFG